MAKIGDMYETLTELTTEWKIKDFYSLSQEVNVHYVSPKFYFSGASWEIWFYPNGETRSESTDWLGLYLLRQSSGSPVQLDFSISLKTVDGKRDLSAAYTKILDRKANGWGRPKFILKSNLIERKSELTPSDTLTIICSLKSNKVNDLAGSLFSRHQKLSDDLKCIYKNGERTDCNLTVGNKHIPAHRMILKKRSPVFAAMFTHESKENITGEVLIKDIEKNAMNTILEYLYSGDIDALKTENAISVYTAADKYDIQAVKEICSEFIANNLSVDWICDVIKFSELYEDEKIGHHVREFLKLNARKIIKTEEWKIFAKENSVISVELLTFALEALAPE